MNPLLEIGTPPILIAELGAKYADMPVMKDSIRAARDSGADVVKFQTYRAETISTPGSTFTMEDGSVISQYEFFKAYELSSADHEELIGCCDELGIPWLSTPSHPEDVELLESFSPIAYKTGSDDLTNLRFLEYIARKNRPMIVSTGMATFEEVARAVEAVQGTGNANLILLHCVVSYPSKPEDANLRVIETFRDAFGVPVGLSDHTIDEFTSVLATQLGAQVIEKHFTLDHALKLADHQAALDPAAFKLLADRVRLVSKAMGDGVKRITDTERKWRQAARKSLFSSRAIAKDQVIADEDVAIRRPADGIHPHELDRVIGRTAKVDIPPNTLLTWDMM